MQSLHVFLLKAELHGFGPASSASTPPTLARLCNFEHFRDFIRQFKYVSEHDPQVPGPNSTSYRRVGFEIMRVRDDSKWFLCPSCSHVAIRKWCSLNFHRASNRLWAVGNCGH